MQKNQLEYTLPEKNIAHAPVSPRDHAKLMLFEKSSGDITHRHFYDLEDSLTKDDVLIFNDTKVFPARLYGKKETGGTVEVLLLRKVKPQTWQVLGKSIPSVDQPIYFDNIKATVTKKTEGEIQLEFNVDDMTLSAFLEEKGHMPLPPYITSPLSESEVRNEYQTIYAKEAGSVAAPTAGLHFTDEMLSSLQKKGIQIEFVTLHVGAGTFLPIKEANLVNHIMHSEYFSIEASTLAKLNQAKTEGKRIIAVGTTTLRVLESIATENNQLDEHKLTGDTDIFIYPPYQFKFVDALITNFHLPHSTLLALISAFTTEPNTAHPFHSFAESAIGHAYKDAIERKYRFYSFGDAMFIY